MAVYVWFLRIIIIITIIFKNIPPGRLWLRFVDDIFSVIRRDAVEALLCHLNAQHQAIQFTIEREEAETLPFMDIKVRRNGERLFHRNL